MTRNKQLAPMLADAEKSARRLAPMPRGRFGWIARYDSRERAALAALRELRRKYGARIKIGLTDASTIFMGGISANSRGGAAALLAAWITAAQRKIRP